MQPNIHRLFAVLLATAAFLVSACDARPPGPSAAPAPASPRPAPAEPLQRKLNLPLPRIEALLHDRINRERRKRGLPTMRWDDALRRIAAGHSGDMAAKKYFGHTSPEGRGPGERYLRSGYACGITVNGVLLTGAENIFRLSLFAPASETEGDRGAERMSGREVVDAVMRGWLDDRGDRRNILSPDWQREGIGISVGPDGMLYITLNFC